MNALYDLAGGEQKLLAMTTRFYQMAVEDPVLNRLFASVPSDHAPHLAAWLSAQFGGPTAYLQDRGDLRFVIYKHLGLQITDAERTRWAELMLNAAAAVGMGDGFLGLFSQFVEAITRSVQANSNVEPDELRAQLGLQPGQQMFPRKPD